MRFWLLPKNSIPERKYAELLIGGYKTSADGLRMIFCAGLQAQALAACAPKLATAASAKAGGVVQSTVKFSLLLS